MKTEILEQIGLDKDGIKTYITLLKLGSITATKIASETNIHRTNIYRILDNLIAKGLASYVMKNNIKYFSAASPKKLLEDEKKKLQTLKKLVPELESITDSRKEDFKVEVFRGKEGLIAVLKYILREKKDYFVFGEEGNFQKILPYFIKQLLRDIVKLNMQENLLSKESKRNKILLSKNSKIKYLPDQYFSPVMTAVFGDYTAIFEWDEPYHAILIKSKNMSKSYKHYFEILWKTAKS